MERPGNRGASSLYAPAPFQDLLELLLVAEKALEGRQRAQDEQGHSEAGDDDEDYGQLDHYRQDCITRILLPCALDAANEAHVASQPADPATITVNRAGRRSCVSSSFCLFVESSSK